MPVDAQRNRVERASQQRSESVGGDAAGAVTLTDVAVTVVNSDDQDETFPGANDIHVTDNGVLVVRHGTMQVLGAYPPDNWKSAHLDDERRRPPRQAPRVSP